MTLIADLWPLFVIAGLAFCLYAVIRLAGRFSQGAVSAGPRTPPDSLIKGQTDTAVDLRTIEARLDTRPDSMIQRIQQSCAELGVAYRDIPPATPPDRHIDQLLSRLEAHLGFDSVHQNPVQQVMPNQQTPGSASKGPST